MRRKLEFQADRIDAVLPLRGAPAWVPGGTVTPRWVRFQVTPTSGTEASHIKNLSQELAAALDAPSCRVPRRGAAMIIEITRDDSQPVRLLPLLSQLTSPGAAPYPPITATLGLAEDGAPLLIRLPSDEVGHILILGNDGAGKTTLLHSIAISLMLTNSPDKVAFVFLGNVAPLAESARRLGFSAEGFTTPEWSVVISMAVQAAGKRVVVIADDVFIHDNTSVTTMARMLGRENWHFILAWDGIPPVRVTNLFKVKLVGRVSSTEDAYTTTGLHGTGAGRLLGKGDFLALAGGEAGHFQAAHIIYTEIQRLTGDNGRPRLHS